MELKDLSKEQAIEIAKLAFVQTDWITSDFEVHYQPFVFECYEDAREYYSIKFEGYLYDDKTTTYKVEITPDLNVWIWFLENGRYHTHHISNQRKIQDKFTEFGF